MRNLRTKCPRLGIGLLAAVLVGSAVVTSSHADPIAGNAVRILNRTYDEVTALIQMDGGEWEPYTFEARETADLPCDECETLDFELKLEANGVSRRYALNPRTAYAIRHGGAHRELNLYVATKDFIYDVEMSDSE